MLYSIVENWLEFSVNLDFIYFLSYFNVIYIINLFNFYKNVMDNNNNV